MQKIFCFLILFFALAGNVYSQTDTLVISGVVKDYRTKKVLANTTIELAGSDGTNKQITSNEAGYYSITRSQVKEGEYYTMRCEVNNRYKMKTEKFTLESGFPIAHKIIDLELEPASEGCNLYPILSFQKNSSEINEKNWEMISDLFETMRDNPTVIIEISGHADYREIYPVELSQDRAQAIVNILTNKGIDRERLIAVGYGSSVNYEVPFDQGVFRMGDILDKNYVKKLQDAEAIAESIRLNGAASFKVLRNDYKPEK